MVRVWVRVDLAPSWRHWAAAARRASSPSGLQRTSRRRRFESRPRVGGRSLISRVAVRVGVRVRVRVGAGVKVRIRVSVRVGVRVRVGVGVRNGVRIRSGPG